ncbi:MAG TPA: DUF6527 family protein [Thermoanaerobaculia bacterium]|nr:DUF6527 family protein [Thermoanaerobaculia bacterium]
MPKQLEPGVLYVSEEFGAAAHLCACGCGTKVRTPLLPTEWTLEETGDGPTLYPSVGNWQQACKSHYLIRRGEIIWCEEWAPELIAAGRRREEEGRRLYYNELERSRRFGWKRLWNWLKGLLR